jgi:plasmid rolling circle replication initiator protein Rep
MLPQAKPDDRKRIKQMKEVIGLMQENVATQEKVVKNLKDIPVAIPVKDTRAESQHIDIIENKLIKMMINQPPQPIVSHLVQPLIATESARPQQLTKTRMHA